MDDQEKIDLILDWAESHPEFDPEFVDTMQNALERFGSLTPAQSDALDNIITRFRIDT